MGEILNKIFNRIPLVGKRMMTVCLVCGIICILLSLSLIFIDVVQIATTQLTKIENGSIVYNYLRKPMSGAHVWVYLFNITNHEKFILGKDYKLKVAEVGPFVYGETRSNDNFRLKQTLIKYNPRTRVYFKPESSIDYPENVTITMPNLALLDLTSIVSSEDSMVKLGWHHITNKINSKAIITTKASRYLRATQNEPLPLRAQNVIPNLIYLENYGFLDRFYHETIPNNLEVSSSDEDKFSIISRNCFRKPPALKENFEEVKRKKMLGINGRNIGNPAEYNNCNNFSNTYEGFAYPPGITPDFPINLFRNGLCRTLPMVFHKKTIMDSGLHGFIYNLSDDFFTQQPYGDKNGLLNLTKCYKGSPTAFSKVHFQGVDPKLYERIEFIKRNREETGYIVVEPHVALNIKMYLPIQMNLMLGNLSFHVETEPFSNMVLPIGYVKFTDPPLPQSVLEALHVLLVVIPKILLALEVYLISLGLFLLMLYTKSKIKSLSDERGDK